MNIVEKSIYIQGEHFVLTNQRVLYWPNTQTLILSDLHVGKAAHFRRHGIAMPVQVQEKDLERLDHLIRYYHVRRIIVVGDLVHASDNKEVNAFRSFVRSRYGEVDFVLVKGNHDRLSDEVFINLGMKGVYRHFIEGRVLFTHEPIAVSECFQISGHIHPGVSVRLPTNRSLRFPSYVLHDQGLILPAFSHFTGLNAKLKIPQATYFAFYEEGIFEVTV